MVKLPAKLKTFPSVSVALCVCKIVTALSLPHRASHHGCRLLISLIVITLLTIQDFLRFFGIISGRKYSSNWILLKSLKMLLISSYGLVMARELSCINASSYFTWKFTKAAPQSKQDNVKTNPNYDCVRKSRIMHADQSCSKCVNRHLAEGRGRAWCWRDQGAWRERNETSLSAASCLEPEGGKKSQWEQINLQLAQFWILKMKRLWIDELTLLGREPNFHNFSNINSNLCWMSLYWKFI